MRTMMITIITTDDKQALVPIVSQVTCNKKVQQQTSHTTHSSVYPGEYTHLYEGVHFKRTARKPTETFDPGTPGKIEDLGDCYFVEIPLPGIRKEEFVVETCGNILSVVVIPFRAEKKTSQNPLRPAFSFGKYFIQEILLPEDADPLFVSAEYNAGTLEIFIPKSKHAVRKTKTKIAVY